MLDILRGRGVNGANGEKVGLGSIRRPVIGLALAFDLDDSLSATLRRVQNELLDVGADLAMPPRPDEDSSRRLDRDDVLRLEADQSELQSNLEPLKNFVLPGGSPGASCSVPCR